jgi:hypothetical protein
MLDYALPMEITEKCGFVESRSRIVSNRLEIGHPSERSAICTCFDSDEELSDIVQRLEKTIASLSAGGEERT